MPQFNTDDLDHPGQNSAVGGIMSAIPGVNILAPAVMNGLAENDAAKIRRQQLQNAGSIETPDFASDSAVTTQYAGDVNPSLYGTPEAAQATLAQDSPEGRAAQLSALQDLSRVTDQSVGANQAQRRYQAAQDAGQFANSREQAIKQDAMRRGQVGGAADMISRQQAAQAGANRDLGGGLQSAQQAALEELSGTQAKGALAGSLRGQDQNLAFNNADILNKFAQYNTGARNDAAQHNADVQTATAAGNRNAQQDYLNAGTALGMQKLGRSDQNKMAGFGAQMGKYNAINNVLAGQAQGQINAGQSGQAAGKQGMDNFKSLMSMMGGMG